MDKKDFKNGQIVYLEYVGSNRHRTSDDKIFRDKVAKVGNKYITVECGCQFRLEDGRQKRDYSPIYKLYPTLERLELKLEQDELDKLVRSFFGFSTYVGKSVGKLTKEEVATIKQILEEAEKR